MNNIVKARKSKLSILIRNSKILLNISQPFQTTILKHFPLCQQNFSVDHSPLTKFWLICFPAASVIISRRCENHHIIHGAHSLFILKSYFFSPNNPFFPDFFYSKLCIVQHEKKRKSTFKYSSLSSTKRKLRLYVIRIIFHKSIKCQASVCIAR